MTVAQQVQQAAAHFNAGRVSEAEDLLREVLTQDPKQPDALHMLGVIASRAGKIDAAVQLIGQAITGSPKTGFYWASLATVLMQDKRFDKAAHAAREAIRLEAGNADAHYTLARALIGLNEPTAARDELRTTLQIKPQLTDARASLGVLHYEAKRWNDAIECFETARQQRPTDARIWANLSAALKSAGRIDEAVAAAQQAVLLQHDHVGALTNLAQALIEAGQPAAAVVAAQESIRLHPKLAAGQINLGVAYRAMHKLDECVAAYREAIAVDPANVVARANLAHALSAVGRLDESVAMYDEALTLDPADPVAHSGKLFAMIFHGGYTAPDLLKAHREWDDRHARKLAPFSPAYANSPTIGRRLKIGYVSPHFRNHVVAQNILPAYREHDRDRFEIYSYANLAKGDAITDKLKELSHHWRPLAGLNDEQVADQVREDGIDILVDFTLHMGGHRLLAFARRPAPVQATFVGYPGGTGMSAMDYRLTDPYLDPPGTDGHYVEKSIRLADSFWCYEAPLECPPVTDLPAKANGFVTFGCLNGLAKTNAETMAIWAQAMAALPNSRLVMLAPPGSTRDRLAAVMEPLGISRGRLDFVDRLPREQFLAQFNRIDISLDTLPYNGHTTSLESLWMGVPVVSLLGQTVVGRAGWSQLSNLRLGELVALTPKQFVQVTIDLSRDLDRLSQLRQSLRDRMLASPLTSALRFTRNIEDAYRQMWKNWVLSS